MKGESILRLLIVKVGHFYQIYKKIAVSVNKKRENMKSLEIKMILRGGDILEFPPNFLDK